MAMLTVLLTIGPMTLVAAMIELVTRVPYWIHERREMAMFRRSHSLWRKSTY